MTPVTRTLANPTGRPEAELATEVLQPGPAELANRPAGLKTRFLPAPRPQGRPPAAAAASACL